MKDNLISLFLDDEMDLGEKTEFVETVHTDRKFTQETLDLLDQEKLLHTYPAYNGVAGRHAYRPSFTWRNVFATLWPPAAGFCAALLLAGLTSVLIRDQIPQIQQEELRLVLYLPQDNRPNVIGTFTDWSPLPMKRIGSSGYWSLTVKVPEGEHRYSFIVDNGKQMPDPTVVRREMDDFGGENSVIVIGRYNEPVS